MNEYVLMVYYVEYLKKIRKVSDSTIKHYQQAMRYISNFLVKKEKIKCSIYEILDIDELKIIKEYLYSDPDFIEIDIRGHRMYSAGFNHYFRFANGKEFKNIYHQIEDMDIEIPVEDKQVSLRDTWKRSSIIKLQSIEAAGYECEANSKHKTFIAKSTGKPYMEGHHALPMKYQDRFKSSLDIYANIICLCPTCHRLLHYGIISEKINVIYKIYYDRVERLAASGIRISKTEFENLTK